MDALLSARNLLAKALNRSESVSSALEASSHNLHKASSNLSDSSDRLQSLQHRISVLSTIGLHADHASGPVSAHSSVLLLQRSLLNSEPATDLLGYLGSVRRLEQALSFLTENCALAIHWLNDVGSHLDESSPRDEAYVSNVNRSLAVLEELKAMEARDRRPGGVLWLALHKLELELHRMLLETPLDDVVTSVVERLRLNGRGDRVAALYVDARVSVARSRLVSVSGSGSDEGVDVEEWARRVELAVVEVVQPEHDLCSVGPVSMDCYAEIVARSGFLELLTGLGSEVVGSKKDAAKLLRLLEVFGALDALRPGLNRLFGGKECARVQGVIRDLVGRVVEGSVEIFNQLALEVERVKAGSVVDGGAGVPRLVVFVTEYCQVLLDDDVYKRALVQVLLIHRMWHGGERDAPPPERVVVEAVCRIMGALEGKLEKWANRLGDHDLACTFLVNNYRYLHRHLGDTELGRLLGDEYRAKMEAYAATVHPDQCACRKTPGSVVNDDGLALGRRKMSAYS